MNRERDKHGILKFAVITTILGTIMFIIVVMAVVGGKPSVEQAPTFKPQTNSVVFTNEAQVRKALRGGGQGPRVIK